MTLDARFIQRPRVGAWAAQAACAGADMDMFFPSSGAVARRADSAAKAVCRRCPVRDDCQTHAIEHNEQHGTWGGLSERERVALRRSGHVPVDVALYDVTCQVCGVPFQAESPRGSLCTDDCRRAYKAAWRRANRKASA